MKPHPLECRDVGFFSEDSLPEGTVSPQRWASHAFAAIRGENVEVMFDEPRDAVWLDEND